MGYGDVAVTAVMLCKYKRLTPDMAWQVAVREHFPLSLSAQKKGEPKNTFLVLCSEGLVPPIPRKCYTRALKNWVRTIQAVKYLLTTSHTELLNSMELWDVVMKDTGENISQNDQMDVVLALWNAGLIVPNRFL